jgi:hypothetical protein
MNIILFFENESLYSGFTNNVNNQKKHCLRLKDESWKAERLKA